MKRPLSSIFFLLFLNSCSNTAWKAEVLETVLKDFDRHSYFVCVDVKDEGRYVVTNLGLYLYFHQKEGYDKGTYQNYMMPVLKNGSALAIDSLALVKFQFNKVVGAEETIDTAIIFNKYFNKVPENYWLKDGISDEKKFYLINALFDKHIISRTDDESGSLLVALRQFNNKSNDGRTFWD